MQRLRCPDQESKEAKESKPKEENGRGRKCSAFAESSAEFTTAAAAVAAVAAVAVADADADADAGMTQPNANPASVHFKHLLLCVEERHKKPDRAPVTASSSEQHEVSIDFYDAVSNQLRDLQQRSALPPKPSKFAAMLRPAGHHLPSTPMVAKARDATREACNR